MTQHARATVYSTTWCSDCRRAKDFLSLRGVEYTEIDIEKTPEAAEIVARHNNGKHVVPTFEIDGTFYGNPPISKLKELFPAS